MTATTPVDTNALRELVAACKEADLPRYLLTRQQLSKALDFDTVLALCDAYDERGAEA